MRLALAFAVLLVTIVVALAAQSTSTGTGFVVSSDGYVLTNEHVIADASTITVTVENRTYAAEVITQSAETDLALLKIDGEDLPTVPLGNSLYVEPLDEVVSLGYPASQLGEDLTVSTGRITSIRTNVDGREGQETFQHDAVIYSGSSGGPLFDEYGEVIGVNYARIEGSGLQFAIPINDALPLLRHIHGFDVRAMGQRTERLTPQEILAARRTAVAFIECEVLIDVSAFIPDSIPGYAHHEANALDVSGLEDAGFDVQAAVATWSYDRHDIERGGSAQEIRGRWTTHACEGVSVVAVLFSSTADALRAESVGVFRLTDALERVFWRSDLGSCWHGGTWSLSDSMDVAYRTRLAVGWQHFLLPRGGILDYAYPADGWAVCVDDSGRRVEIDEIYTPLSMSCPCDVRPLLLLDQNGYASFEGIATLRVGSLLVQIAAYLSRCEDGCQFTVQDGQIMRVTESSEETVASVEDLIEEFESVMEYAVLYVLEQIGSGD